MRRFCSESPSCWKAEFYSLCSMSLCKFLAVYLHSRMVRTNRFNYFLALTNNDCTRLGPIFYTHLNSSNSLSNNSNNIYLNSLFTVSCRSCKLRFCAT